MMVKNEKKILIISIFISIIFHLAIFGIFYFINTKNQEEKEKIITLTLENLKEKEIKPSIETKKIETKKKEPQKIFTPKQEKPKLEELKPIEKDQKLVEKSDIEETQQKISENPVEQPKQQEQPTKTESTDTNQQSKVEELKPIDITKGKPDTFKQPEKKEEDINGYLKELIRYLNQQARERDLYPPIAKRLKIEGEVIIRVTINEDGTIDENSIKITDPSGYNVLDKGAIEILKKLQPYKKPPKKITVEIPIVFQIIYM